MAGKNYQKAVDDIKSRANIADVIGACVTLKRSGSNHMGCCPFHKEKTPSFSVSEKRGYFHCFGCGESGDVIRFVEKYYNLDFPQAVERLASQYGIVIEETKGEIDVKRDEYYEANRLAARYFFDCLSKSANRGYDYMSKRGLSPKTMQHFGIGYSGEGWTGLTDHLLKNGVSKQTMLELGLASEKNGRLYDKFRQRVIFPIINVRGKVIGFGGRIIGDGEPKYLNSPESPVYLKKLNLYGINLSRDAISREDYAILVEGYMDCVSLFQSGIENVCASCGTALTLEQAKLLKRYTNNVVLCYDSDKAGINAAIRGIDILRAAGMDVKVLNVDDGKDPDEYIKLHGRDAFLELVKNKAMADVDYKVKILRKSYDLNDQSQGIKFLRSVSSIISALSPVEADIYIQKYSKEFGISEGALRREVEKATSQPEEPVAISKETEPEKKSEKPTLESVNLEYMLIRLIMANSSYLEKIRPYPEAFVTEKGRSIRSVFEATYKPGTEFELKALKTELSEDETALLYTIMDRVKPGENDEAAFADCIQKLESRRRRRRIKEILEILEMADSLPEDAVDQNHINKLLTELQSLQSNEKGE